MRRSVAALRRDLNGNAAATSRWSLLPLPYPLRSFAAAASRIENEAEEVIFGGKWSREGRGFDSGIRSALAGRGVIAKKKVYYNLENYELQNHGATTIEHISGIPLFMRQISGSSVGASQISRAQFSQLLKLVTSHLSSVSNIFVQDGAISSSPQCDAKVRLISDNPSAVLSLSKILWKVNCRSISHDPCPLIVYIAGSIRPTVTEFLGSIVKGNNNFAVADIERSSFILCGKSFASATATKDALAALAAPVLSSRGGLLISARLFISGDSLVLLFAQEDTISGCSDLHKYLVSKDAGVVLSSSGAAALLRSRDFPAPTLLKKPDSVVFITADSTGVFPHVSKLSPGQAAYQFLAGFCDGKFMPAYIKGSSPLDPLELARALHLQLKEDEIPTFLINISACRNHAGEDLIKLVESTLSSSNYAELKHKNSKPKVADLKWKYKSFLCGRFKDLPENFYF